MTGKTSSGPALALAAALAYLPAALAQQQGAFQMPPMVPMETPKEEGAIPLYDGAAPGWENAAYTERWSTIEGHRIARNVTRPTILPTLPDPEKATGAGVIVAPGGAFLMLAMDNEGYPVARYLAERGIAAFVLKYRVEKTPETEADVAKMGEARMAAAARNGARNEPPHSPSFALDDGLKAIELVRSRAKEWGVDPNRVGMVGFSAGAMLTLSTALAGKDGARPDFIGVIYGPMNHVATPPDAPPLFAAIAADDPLFAMGGMGLIESWRAAKRPVEFHYYQQGGHGFGMRIKHGTQALWIEQFVAWMEMNGWLGAPKP